MAASKENYDNLNTFFREEYEALQGFVRSRLGDSGDQEAEDIIQDVALRLFSRADDVGRINNIAGYVYHAIKNRIVDAYRTRRNNSYDNEELMERWAGFVELFYSDSAGSLSEKDASQLRTAIANLRPEYRQVIMAIDFEGATYRELGAQTGISPGTLMSRRHRALAILYGQLKAFRRDSR